MSTLEKGTEPALLAGDASVSQTPEQDSLGRPLFLGQSSLDVGGHLVVADHTPVVAGDGRLASESVVEDFYDPFPIEAMDG
jgi:hypothetical protein